LNRTKPYEGARELLEQLTHAGVRTAVCTNKDEKSARRILSHLELMPPVEDVAGPDTFGIQKPDPAHVLRLLERMGVLPQSAILVGDSIHDVKTARAAGISVAVVDWGYSAIPAGQMGADYVLRRFGDLMHIASVAKDES
jgi:phosphoglycolate phosphatase